MGHFIWGKRGNAALGGIALIVGGSSAIISFQMIASGVRQKALRQVIGFERSFYSGELIAIETFLSQRAAPPSADFSMSLPLTFTLTHGTGTNGENRRLPQTREITSQLDSAPSILLSGYNGSNLTSIYRNYSSSGVKSYCGSMPSGLASTAPVCLNDVKLASSRVPPCDHWMEGSDPLIPAITLVNNETELRAVGGKGNFKLTNDITLTGPLPDLMLDDALFDGDGHVIRGLRKTAGGTSRGLFSVIKNAKVKNVRVEDFIIQCDQYSSRWDMPTFVPCYLGAIVGDMQGKSCLDETSAVGGFLGKFRSDGGDSTAAVGGLAGRLFVNSAITNSYAAFAGTSKYYLGGVAGIIDQFVDGTRGTSIDPNTTTTVDADPTLWNIRGSYAQGYLAGLKVGGIVGGRNLAKLYGSLSQSFFRGKLVQRGNFLESQNFTPSVAVLAGIGPSLRADQIFSEAEYQLFGNGVVSGMGAAYHSGPWSLSNVYTIGKISTTGTHPYAFVRSPLKSPLSGGVADDTMPPEMMIAGAFLGYVAKNWTDPLLKLENSYSSLDVAPSAEGLNRRSVGLVDPQIRNTSTTSFWNSDRFSPGLSSIGIAKTTAQLKDKRTYSGWSDRIWKIADGNFPTLKRVPTPKSTTPPACVIRASQDNVSAGSSVTLSMTVTGVSSFAILNEQKVDATGGSITVTANMTRTYRGFVVGEGGAATCVADVHVVDRGRVLILGETGCENKNNGAFRGFTDDMVLSYLVGRFHYDGSLDLEFGDSGRHALVLPRRGFCHGTAAAEDSNGKLTVLAGFTELIAGVHRSLLVGTRYDSDLNLDKSYGNFGSVNLTLPLESMPEQNAGTSLGQASFLVAKMVALPGGKFLVGGTQRVKDPAHAKGNRKIIVLLQVDNNGRLDTSFNAGGTYPGFARIDFPESAALRDFELLPGGGVAGVGEIEFPIIQPGIPTYYTQRALAFKADANGTLEPSFGTAGFHSFSFDSGNRHHLNRIKILSNGKYLAVGGTDAENIEETGASSSNFHMAIVRFNPDGQLDTSFEGSGKKGYPCGSTCGGRSYGHTDALEALPDGKLLALFVPNALLGYGANALLVRMNPDGHLDPSWGNGGTANPRFLNLTGSMKLTPVVLPDGRILAPLQVGALSAIKADGSLDDSFGRTPLDATLKYFTNLSASAAYSEMGMGSGATLQPMNDWEHTYPTMYTGKPLFMKYYP